MVKRGRLDRGFTLVEMLVVITLIGILASLIIFNAAHSRRIARDRRRVSDLNLLHGALQAYNRDGHSYPYPVLYGEMGGLNCSRKFFFNTETNWDCSILDSNGNGIFFLDFLQTAGSPSYCLETECPYLTQDPVDPTFPADRYGYLYTYLTGDSYGCNFSFYVLAALLETDGLSQAQNDQSCWNGQPAGSPPNDNRTYIIVGR